MQIKAIKLYENGFMSQPFAMGGEEGPQQFDPAVKYRSSLQNFLIDTGDQVILVDTGMPAEAPETLPDENAPIYMGRRVRDYVSALRQAGYEPQQVSKILLTHKHADHSGELRAFPQAKIYMSATEAEALGMQGDNVVAVTFSDGPYENFPACQKVAEGVYLIFAPGHTTGNSIVIVEDGDLYYLLHGDVTYTDEALYANKLSVVFEDVAAARKTLNQVRDFIRKHPTVYLSTHTPLGYENLENKKIIDLDAPPESIPPVIAAAGQASGKYVCSVCGYVYDPAQGDPEHGVPAGTPFTELPEDWHCPRCRQDKDKFNRA